MIGYASRTGTRRNLAALDDVGWRLLVSATGVHRTEGFAYAIDNGAWTAYQQGVEFDAAAFETVVGLLGAGADFVVAPDVVQGGAESLALTRRWLGWCLERSPRVLIAVQDGMTPGDVAPLLSPRIGVAVGGSTEWKEAQMHARTWAGVSYLHVLRVNTARRMRLCAWTGADSFDGTSATRFADNIPKLEAWRKDATEQGSLPW